MVHQVVSLLSALLLLLPSASAIFNRSSFRPGAEGDCEGAGNIPAGASRRLQVASTSGKEPAWKHPEWKRALQTNVIGGGNNTWYFREEFDIPTCCTGNGDYDFLQQYLQIRDTAEDDVEEGFNIIPGEAFWSCREGCRADNETYADLDRCYNACFCRQTCPVSNDCLTADCRAFECTFEPGSREQEVCLDECDRQCGERCRSTMNGYIIPLEIYGEALKILDCFYGDLIGNQTESCEAAKVYWESNGHRCEIDEDGKLDCNCIVPGTCYNEVYPCDYEYYCTSNAPSMVPSSTPSDVPSYIPSDIPSFVPSQVPSDVPSEQPSMIPSFVPSSTPSFVPSDSPSATPSDIPSYIPSYVPSVVPSSNPSSIPSYMPSSEPTMNPTPRPTKGKGKGDRPVVVEEEEDDDVVDIIVPVDGGQADDDDDWKKLDDGDNRRRRLSRSRFSNRKYKARSRQGAYNNRG